MYGLAGLYFYSISPITKPVPLNLGVPLWAFAFAVAYNAWYHYSYKWFMQFRNLNLIQILFDMLYVTLLIHFSGGAVSWFWPAYMVLILEGGFLGERGHDAWVTGAFSLSMYGLLLLAEYNGIFSTVSMPYDNNSVQQDMSYLLLKWGWASTLLLVTAGVSAHIMGRIRETERALNQSVITDPLTGLYNRKYFYLRLNSELQRVKRYGGIFSLLMLDIDDFKSINDNYGHLMGDLFLQEISKIIRKSIRRDEKYPKYDLDVPCRVGGEEFAIILPEASSTQASAAAERLRERIEICGTRNVVGEIQKKTETVNLRGVSVTVSIGVASFPEDGNNVDSLFRSADAAMYIAKRRGKNRVSTKEREEIL